MLTPHECPKTKAAVINGEYRAGCSQCLNSTQISAVYANKYRRDRMREKNAKDLVQRYDGDKVNPEWVKLHPDKAIEAFGQTEVENILRS